MPAVPMRRKPKSQYSILNMVPPTAIAPMKAADPKWPTMATSISPNTGVVILLTIAGRAMRRRSRFRELFTA